MQIYTSNPTQETIEQAKQLSKELFQGKELIIKPYSYYQSIPWDVLRIFMHLKGVYCLPTQELIDYLKEEIQDKSAIEIGAGVGSIGKALNIPTTDSRLQERPDIRIAYQGMGQPVIEYADHVEKLDALQAVDKYKPEVVIGAYITELWDDKKQIGNAWGVDEPEMFKQIKYYYHIGDKKTHAYKNLMLLDYESYSPEWLIVRGQQGFIGKWNNLSK